MCDFAHTIIDNQDNGELNYTISNGRINIWQQGLNIAKDNFMFANWEFIEENMNMIFNELKSENYLEGLEKAKLAERLSYYMAELNVLHPFREGNGRTTREFIRQLALRNGYNLDLSKFAAKDILRASIESVVDMNKLQGIIYTGLIEVEE